MIDAFSGLRLSSGYRFLSEEKITAMLIGIHPLLSGSLLRLLDRMGHSDTLVVADANFPAHRVNADVIELPGVEAPRVVAAIRTVLPLDTGVSAWLMHGSDDTRLPVQDELVAAAGCADGAVAALDRVAFYHAAASARLVVLAGETRPYGNLMLAKGVVNPTAGMAGGADSQVTR